MSTLQKAIKLREEGHLESSKELMLKLVDEEPNNPTVLYQCAWSHDVLGLEVEAVPYYVKALETGLAGEDKRGALLGLGSTYRTIGEYQLAKETLENGLKEFPHANEFYPFYAMALYNLGHHKESMEVLLRNLAELTNDEGIKQYQKAILFYADKLDKVWT
ncbi:tetratricopeptide repeat protein [Cytobacillus sp. Hm23]